MSSIISKSNLGSNSTALPKLGKYEEVVYIGIYTISKSKVMFQNRCDVNMCQSNSSVTKLILLYMAIIF